MNHDFIFFVEEKHHVTGKTTVKYNLYTVLVIVEEMDIEKWCHHPSFIT